MSLKSQTFNKNSDAFSLEGQITHLAITAPAGLSFTLFYNEAFEANMRVPVSNFFELNSKIIITQKIEFSPIIDDSTIEVIYEE